MVCKKMLLYQVASSGLLYLTIDNQNPIFVEFQHHIKLEACLFTEKRRPPIGFSVGLDPLTQSQGDSSVSENAPVQEKTLSISPRMDGHRAKRRRIKSPKPSCRMKKIKSCAFSIPLEVVKSENIAGGTELPETLVSQSHSGAAVNCEESSAGTETSILREKNPGEISIETSIVTYKNPGETSTDTPVLTDRNPGGISRDTVSENTREDNAFICQFCLKSFDTKLELNQHTKVTSSEVYKCWVCKANFPFRALLLVHTNIHRQDTEHGNVKSFVCVECGEATKNRGKLRHHMFTHTNEFVYQCCICEQKVTTLAALSRHQAKHFKIRTLRCSCCGEHFCDRAALTRHKMAVRDLKCSVCNEEFPNRTSHNIHMKVEHGDQLVRCKLCSHQQLFSPADLLKHMEQHRRHKRKQCGICGLFVSRLDKHRLIHLSPSASQEVDNKPFMCEHCPKRFKRRDTLTEHMEGHSKERSHKCHICSKTFARGGVLRKHYKTHSGLMPFECEICGKRCLEKSNLMTHMRVHSKTTVYHCHVCYQGFKHKSSLDSHLRAKHSTGAAHVQELVTSGPLRPQASPTSETESTALQFPITLMAPHQHTSS